VRGSVERESGETKGAIQYGRRNKKTFGMVKTWQT
jgi:hypothetical protein